MTKKSVHIGGGKFFCGWINVAVLFISYATVVASISYAFGVVVADMSKNLGMTMTMATGAYTGYTLVHAVTAPLAGKFIGRFGAKRSMLFGQSLMMAGCLLLALTEGSVAFYYVFWIVFIGFGMRFGTLLPSQVNISKWFFNYRGLAMAVLLAAGGIGGYIFTPLCTAVNESASWRAVWLMIALFIALSILLILILVKETPEKCGLEVDGGSKPETGIRDRTLDTYKTREKWTVCDARRHIAFYMLVFLYFSSSYQLSVISAQGINHLALQGIARTSAASAVGLFAFINTFGRIIVGLFGDRIDMRKILGTGALLSIVGFAVLMYADSITEAYIALVLSGMGYGIIMVAPQNMLLNYFGNYDYANINGLYSLIAGVMAAAPAVLVGWFFDISGNYTFAWVLGIFMMMAVLVISVTIKPPKLTADRKGE